MMVDCSDATDRGALQQYISILNGRPHITCGPYFAKVRASKLQSKTMLLSCCSKLRASDHAPNR